MQQLLKKTFKTIVVLLTALPLFNCSDDTYPLERHSKINTSKKDVSFSQFKKETQQDNFALFKSITLDKQLKKRYIKNDFIIDTTKILKHVAQNNKATYSFRIYPIDKNALKPHEYYNLVYHKNGGQWAELLFKNKEALNTQSGDYRLKSSEVIYMSTPQLQSRTIISVGAGTMCETPTTTFNCTKTGSCSSGVCDLCSLCVSTSVAYEYCGSGGGGSSSEGDYGNEGGESGGGGGGLEGVYIPIPYEGEQDINNPDFLFAIEVAGFINTLPQHLNNVVLANNWMHNTIINFMKNNGGLNIDNQNKVAFALANYDSVASIPMSNLPFTTINQLHYWAFNYLLEKPNVEAADFTKQVINYCSINYSESDRETTELFFKALKDTNNFQDNLTESFVQDNISYFSEDVQNQFLIDPTLVARIAQEYLIQRAAKKYLHRDWNEVQIYYSILWDFRHMSLDAFGLIPVFGEVADLANGVLYTIEGDGVNATLSYASAVPIVGWASLSTKYAIKVKNATSSVSTITHKVLLVWKMEGNILKFGHRSELRKVIGLAVSDARQAHHIIPWAKSIHPAIQKAAKSADAFHMNEALNGIPLGRAIHNGSHFEYDRLIQRYLDAIPTNVTPNQAYNEVVKIIDKVKTAIKNNPNTPINQLIF
ncbi:hypothetical protein FVB9288_03305 [Flavobacterium sp. CECT 9288]|uniref:AHH domain-containing protein n=1 Tax=Flavobacterium sp. CECT 9288 TaxID=2845819 RepID=UPI001E321D29|nr:AHH domain-containing protein [Flavobacterium sp. CECT 9288]CAH0337538.1 hypothetical protein FVB9288_03305 [Flavobacterium sp. CECT 9288]